MENQFIYLIRIFLLFNIRSLCFIFTTEFIYFLLAWSRMR